MPIENLPKVPLIVEGTFDPDWDNEFGHPTGLVEWARNNLRYGQRMVCQRIETKDFYHYTVRREKIVRGKTEITWSVTKNMRPYLRGGDSYYEVLHPVSGYPMTRYEQHWNGEGWVWMTQYTYVKKRREGLEIPKRNDSFADYCGERFFVILHNRMDDKKDKVQLRLLRDARKYVTQQLLNHFKNNHMTEIDDNYVAVTGSAIRKLITKATGKVVYTDQFVNRVVRDYIKEIERGW